MWVMTPRGFYSAVQKRDDRAEGMVTVRARNKGDIDRLSDLIDAKPYKQKGYSDYPWRLRCPRETWMAAVTVMAGEIDYANFKDEVKRVQGAARAGVYSRVWGVLLSLEQRPRRRRRAAGTSRWADERPLFGGYDDELLR